MAFMRILIKCKKPLELAGKIHGIERNKKRKQNFTIDNYITAHLGIISISLLNCRIKLRHSFALNSFIFFFYWLFIFQTSFSFRWSKSFFNWVCFIFILKADFISSNFCCFRSPLKQDYTSQISNGPQELNC